MVEIGKFVKPHNAVKLVQLVCSMLVNSIDALSCANTYEPHYLSSDACPPEFTIGLCLLLQRWTQKTLWVLQPHICN